MDASTDSWHTTDSLDVPAGLLGFLAHREAADGNSHLGENDAVECIWKLGCNTKRLGRTAAELVKHMSIDAAVNDRSCRRETEKSVCS